MGVETGRSLGPRCPIIILNWNGWEDTFGCLRSIVATGECPLVWLVDNASEVDRADEACDIYFGLRTFRWDENYGWAGGYNRALRIAIDEGYEFAYLLNNDCLVTPRFLSTVIGVAESDPCLAGVGSSILYASSPEFAVYDGHNHGPGERRYVPSPRVRDVEALHGAGMLVRLSCVQRYGLIEEAYFCYGEETDWSKRMIEHGCRLAVANESVILHQVGRSDVDNNGMYYLCRNKFLHLKRSSESHWTRLLGGAREVYLSVRWANEQRRVGNYGGAAAVTDALWHVARNQFGRRGSAAPEPFHYLVTHSWPFPAGFFRQSGPSRTVRIVAQCASRATGLRRGAADSGTNARVPGRGDR